MSKLVIAVKVDIKFAPSLLCGGNYMMVNPLHPPLTKKQQPQKLSTAGGNSKPWMCQGGTTKSQHQRTRMVVWELSVITTLGAQQPQKSRDLEESIS